MDFSGRYTIPASPEVVWAALNDPDVLKSCIPGCESLEKTDATHFAATAVLKIGPVKATFKAAIEQSDLDPPRKCILKGEGQGGVAGFAKGVAEVLLAADEAGTVLSYSAKASIGGKLAQIGQRLIDGAAKQIADDFFSRFAKEVTQAQPAMPFVADVPEPESSPDATPRPRDAKREGLASEIWVFGLLGVIAILLVIFGLTLRPS